MLGKDLKPEQRDCIIHVSSACKDTIFLVPHAYACDSGAVPMQCRWCRTNTLGTRFNGNFCSPFGTPVPIAPSSSCTQSGVNCEGLSLSGSISHAVFEAEPDSALAHMCNGKWEYYKDDQGRAQVMSNPAHWPRILDWLMFKIIPAHPTGWPTAEIISECRFWHLNRLQAAIDDKQDGYIHSEWHGET